MNRIKKTVIAGMVLLCFASCGLAQQPQTSTAPLQDANVRTVQGVGPGYWPTASGLNINITAGTVMCATVMTTYSGGSLTMSNNTTNYIYLNTASSCIPAVKTTAFTSSDIPIAEVVTLSGVVTNIYDLRGAPFNISGLLNNNVGATNLPTPGATCTFTAPRTYCILTTTATITVPVPAAGDEFCAFNSDNVSTTITLSAIGSSAQYENTARTAYGTAGSGTLVSSGAVGDKICILGLDSTHYITTSFQGTWTAS